MAYFAEKSYNSGTDRLFLVYYALPDTIINENGWAVNKDYIAENIDTAVGKPFVVKRKDPTNPMDQRQKGNFVHPMLQFGAGVKDLFNYQENFAIGRINKVSLNPQKGWRFDVEVTDPVAKSVLKSDEHIEDYPPYVSPLVLAFPHHDPEYDPKDLKHWIFAHLAAVDQPAFGFDLMQAHGKCYGKEEVCEVKLMSASEEQSAANFCIKEAMLQLIGSSQVSQNSNATTVTSEMSETPSNQNMTVPGTTKNTTVVTQKPNTIQERIELEKTNSVLKQHQNSGNESDSPPQPKPQDKGEEGESKPEQQQEAKSGFPATLDEAINEISSLRTVLDELKSNQAKTNKYIADLQKKERLATLRNIIPRQLFKSEDKYSEELERVYNWRGMEDKDIAEHYQNKLLGMTIPTPKTASTEVVVKDSNLREIPEFHKASIVNSENKISSSNVSKLYRLQKLIEGSG